MDRFTKDHSQIIAQKEKASIYEKMENNIQDNEKIIKCMVISLFNL